jgi:hypothetical protein
MPPGSGFDPHSPFESRSMRRFVSSSGSGWRPLERFKKGEKRNKNPRHPQDAIDGVVSGMGLGDIEETSRIGKQAGHVGLGQVVDSNI